MELKQGSYREVARPDPQVPEKPLRRQFTANYKLQVLQQADTCSKFGDIERLLRRNEQQACRVESKCRLEMFPQKTIWPKVVGAAAKCFGIAGGSFNNVGFFRDGLLMVGNTAGLTNAGSRGRTPQSLN